MHKFFKNLSHKQGLSLASLAIIALAIPIGIVAVQQPQLLGSLAASKSLNAPIQAKECAITGCGGELCVDADYAPLQTNCSLSQRFACYQEASCVLQADGNCGFVITEEVQACLDAYGINVDPNQPFIQTTQLTTGILNQNYSDVVQTDNTQAISNISLYELPPGLNTSCSNRECTITGSPTQPGRYQVVALATHADGQIEQDLIPLTIRTGGTLQRTQ